MKRGPNTSTAVMQRKGPAVQEADTEQEAVNRRLNLYATPPWAARAGAEYLAAMFPQARYVLEPAAGLGHIARPAADYFPLIGGSDVHDHGAGFPVRDWLDDDLWDANECDLVYTNPPFDLAHEFVTKGLVRARLGVALILRIAFLEGGERYSLLGDGQLTQVVTFSERVPMVLGKWDPEASSASCYALFIFSKRHAPRPLAWFPPGTRDRLWRKDDPAVYGFLPPLPLFPEA
jgi:hypothetical protein